LTYLKLFRFICISK